MLLALIVTLLVLGGTAVLAIAAYIVDKSTSRAESEPRKARHSRNAA
jgi:hypothetical protein